MELYCFRTSLDTFLFSKVLLYFWPECLQRIVLCFNNFPTKTNTGLCSPLSALKHEQDDIELLAPFGCAVEYLLPPNMRSKLSPVSQEAVFLHAVPERKYVVAYNRTCHLIVKTVSFKFFFTRFPVLLEPCETSRDVLSLPWSDLSSLEEPVQPYGIFLLLLQLFSTNS